MTHTPKTITVKIKGDFSKFEAEIVRVCVADAKGKAIAAVERWLMLLEYDREQAYQIAHEALKDACATPHDQGECYGENTAT